MLFFDGLNPKLFNEPACSLCLFIPRLVTCWPLSQQAARRYPVNIITGCMKNHVPEHIIRILSLKYIKIMVNLYL